MEMLNDMALFVEVAKLMSFRKAADATGVSISTISRRIRALEQNIGLRLLHRTTRKLELTEPGQMYYERCRAIVDEARTAHEKLGELLAQPSGQLRASLPVDFATFYLAPLLVEFSRLYPQIAFDFDLTPRRVDLVSEPFDVAIRMGELPSSPLIARQLAQLPVRIYTSPQYLRSFGEPVVPLDLACHQCIGFPKSGKWKLRRDAQIVEVGVTGRFQLNSVGMLQRLATLGAGIVMLPEEIAAEDVRVGKLQQILPEWEGTPIPVYALTETRLVPAKTQRFIEFLREHLASLHENC